MTGVLVTLDSIESVIDEAIETGLNMIIAHHPILFKGLKKINVIEEKVVVKEKTQKWTNTVVPQKIEKFEGHKWQDNRKNKRK